MAKKSTIQALYYMTHFDNIISILEKGIFSHQLIQESPDIKPTTIYNQAVMQRRAQRIVDNNMSLWHFANLYFQPRNAMLYAVKQKFPIHKVAIISIKPSILDRSDVFITTGNAASHYSQIMPVQSARDILPQISQKINQQWWTEEDGSKREMMAECLVPKLISPDYIQMIYVGCDRAKEDLKKMIDMTGNIQISKIPVVVEPYKFFQPEWMTKLSDKISLIRGDMFFSQMQTLTVSVNCVGVMGKGLASTAKYRFPNVYVEYQEICKNKKLKMGEPYLLKRELSIFKQLADETWLLDQNFKDHHPTWFLLFPTKDHWRNNSNIADIEKGLQWLVENYQKEGITSLAMPALGCGLGGLEWREVGPLMVRYLNMMNITIAIYLPAEKQIPPNFLSKEFLLGEID